MPLQIMQIKPGIVKDITPYSAGKNGPYWIDGNLIRFKNGYAEKIGGWLKQAYTRVDASGSYYIYRNYVCWHSKNYGGMESYN
jgi:hypothetical protein